MLSEELYLVLHAAELQRLQKLSENVKVTTPIEDKVAPRVARNEKLSSILRELSDQLLFDKISAAQAAFKLYELLLDNKLWQV